MSDSYLDELVVVTNHPKQLEIFNDPTPYRIIIAGRRFGKSCLLTEEVLRVASEKNTISWLVSPTREMGERHFWDNLQRRCDALNWEYKANQKSLSLYRYSTNSEIQIMSGEKPDRLRGDNLNFAGLDEFAFMKEEVWQRQIKPMLNTTRGKAMVCSSPFGYNGMYRLYQLGQDRTQNYYKSWKFTSLDSPFTDKEAIEFDRKHMSEQEFKQEYLADFISNEGLVYSAFRRENNIKQLEIDYNLPLRISFDFNVSPMTTSISQIVEGRKENNEQDKVLNVLRTINNFNFRTIEQCQALKRYLEQINWEDRPLYFYGDPAGIQRTTNSNVTNWEIIEQEFPRGIFLYTKKAPAVTDRVNCVNAKILSASNEIGLYIQTGEDAKELIRDFEEVFYKGNIIDKTLEKRNLVHNSDNIGYLICEEFPIRHYDTNIY